MTVPITINPAIEDPMAHLLQTGGASSEVIWGLLDRYGLSVPSKETLSPTHITSPNGNDPLSWPLIAQFLFMKNQNHIGRRLPTWTTQHYDPANPDDHVEPSDVALKLLAQGSPLWSGEWRDDPKSDPSSGEPWDLLDVAASQGHWGLVHALAGPGGPMEQTPEQLNTRRTATTPRYSSKPAKTPWLHALIDLGHTDMVFALLSWGANPNQTDQGRPALFDARTPELVTSLLNFGADPYIKNTTGLIATEFWRASNVSTDLRKKLDRALMVHPSSKSQGASSPINPGWASWAANLPRDNKAVAVSAAKQQQIPSDFQWTVPGTSIRLSPATILALDAVGTGRYKTSDALLKWCHETFSTTQNVGVPGVLDGDLLAAASLAARITADTSYGRSSVLQKLRDDLHNNLHTLLERPSAPGEQSVSGETQSHRLLRRLAAACEVLLQVSAALPEMQKEIPPVALWLSALPHLDSITSLVSAGKPINTKTLGADPNAMLQMLEETWPASGPPRFALLREQPLNGPSWSVRLALAAAQAVTAARHEHRRDLCDRWSLWPAAAAALLAQEPSIHGPLVLEMMLGGVFKNDKTKLSPPSAVQMGVNMWSQDGKIHQLPSIRATVWSTLLEHPEWINSLPPEQWDQWAVSAKQVLKDASQDSSKMSNYQKPPIHQVSNTARSEMIALCEWIVHHDLARHLSPQAKTSAPSRRM